MRTLTAKLDTNDINRLIKDLQNRKLTLKEQCKEFVSRLADKGIETAKANGGEYGNLIMFSKEIEDTVSGAKGIMLATDGTKIVREWKYKGGTKTAEVSPLLMAEFGSGWLAKNLDGVEGVGQGTFPGQTHAFDPYGWWWTTPDGKKHHSKGEAPTFPMHAASVAMIMEINDVAREVFHWQ